MKYRIIAIIVFSCLFYASSVFAKLPPEARQAIHKSQLLLNEKKYAQAASTISQYLASTEEPAHASIYLTLGGAYHQAGNKKAALKTYLQGHSLFVKNVHLCQNAAISAYELGHYAKAANLLETTYAIQKKPNPNVLYQSGSAYYLAQKYTAGIAVLTKLLHSTKKPQKEWIRLFVHTLIAAKQFSQAKNMVLRLLTLSPEEADYWRLLAKLYLDKEDFTNAASALEICYRLTSPTRREIEQLASLYAYQQAPLMAATTLQRAYKKTASPEQTLRIAAFYASAGRVTQAIHYLEKFPQNLPVLLEKGKILYAARRFADAEKALHQTLQTKKLPEAHLFLALCAWEKREWAKAQKELSYLTRSKKYKRQVRQYLAALDDIQEARETAQ